MAAIKAKNPFVGGKLAFIRNKKSRSEAADAFKLINKTLLSPICPSPNHVHHANRSLNGKLNYRYYTFARNENTLGQCVCWTILHYTNRVLGLFLSSYI